MVVAWDESHNSFKIYLHADGSPLHFLHSESITPLGLDTADTGRKMTVGEVVEKEYCQAKKAQNRFGVPQGTKFYRVKCKPVTS